MNNLKGQQLIEDLNYLSQMLLEYRDKLNFNRSTTFGMEIEFENAKFYEIKSEMENLDDWKIIDDISVMRTIGFKKCGGEVISPICDDSKDTWNELKEICNILKKNNASSTNRTGGHVHVGIQEFKNDYKAYRNFLILYASYEPIIYRFLAGENSRIRSNASRYAKPFAYKILVEKNNIINFNCLDDVRNFIYRNNDRKGYGLNFANINLTNTQKEKNTIEFRSPNGTVEEVIWQNNVNFIIKLIDYCSSSNFDYEFLLDKFNKIHRKNINFETYELMNIKEALELSNLLFDNQLDKDYFLRQYFKDFDLKTEQKRFLK